MRDDELKQLLTRAEADLPAHSPVTSDTVRAVQRRFVARQRRRRLTTGASCLALVFALVWRFVPTQDTLPSPADQVASADVVHQLAELRQLQEQTASELRVVKRMLELERAARQRAERTTVDYQPTVAEQRDEVAYRMILQADSLSETMQPSERAMQIYRRVLELYPSSSSAELARERLSKLDLRGGNI